MHKDAYIEIISLNHGSGITVSTQIKSQKTGRECSKTAEGNTGLVLVLEEGKLNQSWKRGESYTKQNSKSQQNAQQ